MKASIILSIIISALTIAQSMQAKVVAGGKAQLVNNTKITKVYCPLNRTECGFAVGKDNEMFKTNFMARGKRCEKSGLIWFSIDTDMGKALLSMVNTYYSAGTTVDVRISNEECAGPGKKGFKLNFVQGVK